jgi:non-ribosomal peptide synthetase component F
VSFLDEVRSHALEVYENQDYPFEMLVEKVSSMRDVSRNPLFDVMFAWEDVFGVL